MGTRTAVDIGGTFTDLVYLDEVTGKVGLGKTSTTPAHFEEGVIVAVTEAELRDVQFLAHGTTVIINTLTERKGAVTALITTRGFRDILEIQRANRPDLYNLLFTKPKPFIPRRLRFEVTERMNYKGEVLTPLVEEDVRAAVAEARRQGVEAIAVCFLHSYANPSHEQRAIDIIRSEWPDVDITASHELTNEWREFQRTSTAVLDAYVKPVARRYLNALSRRLDEAVSAGYYHSPGWNKDYPRLQIFTIDELLHGAEVKMPPPFGTFKDIQKVVSPPKEQQATFPAA